MIQVKQANNLTYNTDDSTLELKNYMSQIASTQNLREQLINQIYIITNIQKAINDDSIINNLDTFLVNYNDSISHINSAIISSRDKLHYFNVNEEKSSYEKKAFTMRLATKCKEVEVVFDQIAILNAQAITGAKEYINLHEQTSIDSLADVNVNNAILANNI